MGVNALCPLFNSIRLLKSYEKKEINFFRILEEGL
jgi:hypothetical protein